tara:strand:- start:260 stop:559 length:300 start_codon:yes stop_codon:yes gene_type:complete
MTPSFIDQGLYEVTGALRHPVKVFPSKMETNPFLSSAFKRETDNKIKKQLTKYLKVLSIGHILTLKKLLKTKYSFAKKKINPKRKNQPSTARVEDFIKL